MSYETYAVGEVAIFWNPGDEDHSKEATVTSILKWGPYDNTRTGRRHFGPYYEIDLEEDAVAPPWHLRKKPGPVACQEQEEEVTA